PRAPPALHTLSLHDLRVLLPEPDTPVTQMKSPRGNSTSMFLRLWARAPRTRKTGRSPFSAGVYRRIWGTGMERRPDRYCPVRELGLAATSAGVPWARS